VDTFHGHDQLQLLDRFEQQVFDAIREKVSLNPVLQSFQLIVNQYQIEHGLIRSFLAAMRMDIEKKTYSETEYKNYIHGSAEVIGLMCLRIFCEGDEVLYKQLMPPAVSLGSALQKINFLRDMKADEQERSRVYFPGVDPGHFDEQAKKLVEQDIRHDLDAGFKGIGALPAGARLGVYIAYTYYLELFRKLSRTPASVVLQKRIRIPDAQKTLLYCKAVLRYKLGMI